MGECCGREEPGLSRPGCLAVCGVLATPRKTGMTGRGQRRRGVCPWATRWSGREARHGRNRLAMGGRRGAGLPGALALKGARRGTDTGSGCVLPRRGRIVRASTEEFSMGSGGNGSPLRVPGKGCDGTYIMYMMGRRPTLAHLTSKNWRKGGTASGWRSQHRVATVGSAFKAPWRSSPARQAKASGCWSGRPRSAAVVARLTRWPHPVSAPRRRSTWPLPRGGPAWDRRRGSLFEKSLISCDRSHA